MAQLAGDTDFSPSFATALTHDFPLVDLNHITHVRLVDIIGDGSAFDARGSVIYDPYATVISAGFDLDAIGVLNEGFISYADWAVLHSVYSDVLGDADGDRVVDFQEYMLGGDPNLAASAPVPVLGSSTNGTDFVALEYALSRDAYGTTWVETSANLVEWTNAMPQANEHWRDTNFVHSAFHFQSSTNGFYRLVFEIP